MELDDFRQLLTPAGQAVLQAARQLQPREDDFLRHYQALCRRHPAGLARAALETAILQMEAAAKFPKPEELYFTRPALEQSTPWQVARHRARRYQDWEQVLDLGCSIGGDCMALAVSSRVLGIDLDPLRLHMAAANLRARGLADRALLVQADLNAPLPAARRARTALFFDPARRAGQRRIFSVGQYSPRLDLVKAWQAVFPAAGVKISPGVRLDELAGYDAEIEFVSLQGELKEAVLWFGPFKTAARRATLLPGGHSLAGDPDETAGQPRLPVRDPRAYIYEPDPAVLRAGLVQQLGSQMDAAQMDADIAYLTAETNQPTPFARVWAVEDWMPFNLKKLRACLRERGVGRLTVKKRGSPIEPADLIHDLRLEGDAERVLFLTHLKGEPVVVIAFPPPA